jgi:hypothetical protein
MRLGKEQSIGVIEEPAGADCIPLDEPSEIATNESHFSEEPAGDAWQVSGLSDRGSLIRSR